MQQLISFYFAGVDTTSHTLGMALYALAEYPTYQQQIKEEIREHVPTMSAITYETLSKLTKLDHFLN